MTGRIPLTVALAVVTIFVALPVTTPAQIERFMPRQGGDTEIWRITDDPGCRDWANYQNTEAWSPDGRYICYEAFESPHEVYVYDFAKSADILVGKGTQPRWANTADWLFYLRPSEGGGNDVVRLDMNAGESIRLASGLTGIGETDSDDRWIFGKTRTGIVRVPIAENARVEDISAGGALGSFMIPNPAHPLVMFRGDSRDAEGRDIDYAPTRVWSDLEGNNVVTASPMIQRCHQAWSGDGTYHMHGNSQMRGRFWNEPFPSNLHYIANVDVHDICSCGRSGRWVIGSGNVWPLTVADLRSGDGHDFLRAALSFIHDSETFSYSAGSGLHDNDAKGSPDGTKVVFSCNYDLKDGPVCFITADVADPDADSIPVTTTEGFPPSGRLSVQNEIIGYARKTPTSFEGLTRRMHNSMPFTGSMLEDQTPERRELYVKRPNNTIQLDRSTPEILKPYLNKPLYLSKGIVVSSFDARLVPESKRRHSLIPERYTSDTFPGDYDSILQWQRQTDVYVAVIRKPDQPVLRETGGEYEIVPGENHYETRGYHILRDGTVITKEPLRPGTFFTLPGPGTYTASAVEWSGLESGPGVPLTVTSSVKVRIRADKPGDFQWTADRWLVNGKEVDERTAEMSQNSIRETVHLMDGVIARELYIWEQIEQHYDINEATRVPNGEIRVTATRRLFYHDGVLARREYHTADGRHVSTELFAPDGYIVESIRYHDVDGVRKEIGHWWFEKGNPVKLIGSEGHTLVAFPGIYTKEGDRFVWKPMK